MGLREQKRRETRRRMLDAARRLFEEQGYDETTVEMIAADAGVSARTFHRYFDTKDGVVAEAGTAIVRRAIEELEPGASVADIIRALAAAVEEGLDDGDVGWSVELRRENHALRESLPIWLDRWAELVADALATAEGRTQPTLADRVKSSTAVHVSATAADEWILREHARSFSELAHEAVDILEQDLGKNP
jgi:AcrR family transcriptional regulator